MTNSNTLNIQDLPTEILQNALFKYLDRIDIHNLSKTGNWRLKEISEDYSSWQVSKDW